MHAREFLSNRLFPLKPGDTVQMAMELLNASDVAYLPVVREGHLKGYISSSQLMDIRPRTRKLEALLDSAPAPRIMADQHLFEVIRVFAQIQSTVLAVVDSEEEFLGIISAKELIRKMAGFSGLTEQGSILTLRIGLQDYSLSEIARLVEYNNAKILSLQLEAPEEERQLMVHLKLNTHDLKSLVATFERYNYEVEASYLAEDDQKNLKDRYDQLMRYLDI